MTEGDRPSQPTSTEWNRVVCLGEVLVDFVGTHPSLADRDPPSFVPSLGGSQANIAAGAARFGADSTFVGGVGDDHWGRWLRERLVAEGVDVAHLRLLDGIETPIAFAMLSEEGEPEFAFHGDREQCVVSATDSLEDLFADGSDPRGERGGAPSGRSGVFSFGSDTLIGERERELTRDARERALAGGWRVLYDPNLRPVRWPDPDRMRAEAAELVAGCAVVKVNLAEARVLTGRGEAGEAARALAAACGGAAIVTAGARGAMLAIGDAEPLTIEAPPVRVVDATGAGDSLAAIVAAALARGASIDALPTVVALGVRTAARVVEARGALTGLPAADEASAALDRALGLS